MDAFKCFELIKKIVSYGTMDSFEHPHHTLETHVEISDGVEVVFKETHTDRDYDPDGIDEDDEDGDNPRKWSEVSRKSFRDPDESLGPSHRVERILYWMGDEVCGKIASCLEQDRDGSLEHSAERDEDDYQSEDEADADTGVNTDEYFAEKERERLNEALRRATEHKEQAETDARHIAEIRLRISELINAAAVNAVPASWDEYYAIERYALIRRRNEAGGEK